MELRRDVFRLRLPAGLKGAAAAIVEPIRDGPLTDLPDLLRRIRGLEGESVPVTIFPDVEENIRHRLFQQLIEAKVAEIRRDPKAHPLRTTLLKAELLPYQLDGIAFAAGAGRAIQGDDTGLDKTIQGIGVAESLIRKAGNRKVLVICPASVKSQWRGEAQVFGSGLPARDRKRGGTGPAVRVLAHQRKRRTGCAWDAA